MKKTILIVGLVVLALGVLGVGVVFAAHQAERSHAQGDPAAR